jgi:potassium/chloride transporter 9
MFSRASNVLLVVVFLATLSIPLSGVFVRPFESPKHRILYTGPSIDTLRDNLYPQLTKGADGSEGNHTETWQDLFGVLFPATTGIFA